MRGGTPLGALDIYIAPPPLEAWGAVIQSCRASRKCAATRPTIASITLRTRRHESQVPIEPLPHRTSCQSSMHSLASGHSKKVGSDASRNGASSPTCEAQHHRPRYGGSASMLADPDAHHAANPKQRPRRQAGGGRRGSNGVKRSPRRRCFRKTASPWTPFAPSDLHNGR